MFKVENVPEFKSQLLNAADHHARFRKLIDEAVPTMVAAAMSDFSIANTFLRQDPNWIQVNKWEEIAKSIFAHFSRESFIVDEIPKAYYNAFKKTNTQKEWKRPEFRNFLKNYLEYASPIQLRQLLAKYVNPITFPIEDTENENKAYLCIVDEEAMEWILSRFTYAEYLDTKASYYFNGERTGYDREKNAAIKIGAMQSTGECPPLASFIAPYRLYLPHRMQFTGQSFTTKDSQDSAMLFTYLLLCPEQEENSWGDFFVSQEKKQAAKEQQFTIMEYCIKALTTHKFSKSNLFSASIIQNPATQELKILIAYHHGLIERPAKHLLQAMYDQGYTHRDFSMDLINRRELIRVLERLARTGDPKADSLNKQAA